jgi:Recombinase zinc beta ribbon domain
MNAGTAPAGDAAMGLAERHRLLIDRWFYPCSVSRRADTEGKTLRFESGRLSGRPPKHAARNLLAGLAACGVCGGGLVVETSGRKAGRVPQYMCSRYRHQGTCKNGLRIDVMLVNEAVLQAIEEHALTPEAVETVVALSERDDMREQQRTLEQEQKDVERRITRLVTAIENGGDIAPITDKLRALKARKDAIAASLASLQPVPRLPAPVVAGRLAEWRRLLRQSTTQGQAVLQRLLDGRIKFTPNDSGGYDFTCPTRFDKLFAGVAAPVPAWMLAYEGEGKEGMRPEDTLEADYGVLLERVYANPPANHGKWLASPAGVEPASPP